MTARIMVGDARDVLPTLAEKSVHVTVCSPPYFGLRDYGTATWAGGDAGCDHLHRTGGTASSTLGEASGGHAMSDEARVQSTTRSFVPYRDRCGKCGAVRVDRQLGIEPTVAEYVATLVGVFREVWRVLRDDGCCFVVLGDSYSGGGGFSATAPSNQDARWVTNGGKSGEYKGRRPTPGLKPKDLCLVPERFRIAAQEDGWYVRSVIRWCKTSCMPESVRDRPTSAVEDVVLLTKRPNYFWDAEAIKEPAIHEGRVVKASGGDAKNNGTGNRTAIGFTTHDTAVSGRNPRNYLILGPEPFSARTMPTGYTEGEATTDHFAVMPTKLASFCIRAATSERGCCPRCGAGWVRVVERSGSAQGTTTAERIETLAVRKNAAAFRNRPDDGRNAGFVGGDLNASWATLGWRQSCPCAPADPVPSVVLDPFLGSGTTLLVADRLGRDGIGVELSPDYAALARQRITGDAPMFANVTLAGRTDR